MCFMSNMKIERHIFDQALLISLPARTDLRGGMTSLDMDTLKEILPGFLIREQRLYRMPKKNTFFGIHYQEEPHRQAKIVTVLSGKGRDYVIDLRSDSPTFLKWESIELDAGEPKLVYIPEGFGHAFLSLEENTMQLFAVNEKFIKGYSKSIRYDDPDIGLNLPDVDLILSEQDRTAPYSRDM